MKSLKDRIDDIDTDLGEINANETDRDAPIPGTVFNQRQARILRNVVIFMGLMLIGGFALLIGIIAYRASQPAKLTDPVAPAGVSVPQAGILAPSAPTQTAIAAGAVPKTLEGFIPKGARFLHSSTNGNRLVLTLLMPNRDLKLLLIDLHRWQIVGEALLQQQR